MLASVHNKENLIRHPCLSDAFLSGEQTGTIYSRDARSLTYDDDYFLTEYENQYGRTYLADEANLRRMARKRLDLIQQYLKAPANVLEIGSATGFFLDEARKLGCQVQGFEISEFAANYARDHYNLQIQTVDIFEAWKNQVLQHASFDVVCAFYTVEHFPDQVAIMQLISALLKPGGVFCFALPSYYGPALEFHPEQWEKDHPADHFVDYDPISLARVLKLYGMEMLHTFPASFHQNRCRGLKKILPAPIYQMYARKASYGDTMEGIARKTNRKP